MIRIIRFDLKRRVSVIDDLNHAIKSSSNKCSLPRAFLCTISTQPNKTLGFKCIAIEILYSYLFIHYYNYLVIVFIYSFIYIIHCTAVKSISCN